MTLSLQFPLIPPTINTSFSSLQRRMKHCNTNYYSPLKSRLAGRSKCAALGTDKEKNDQIQLPEGLKPELMPKHVAVIMDGNRRWALNRGLPVQLGHKAGSKALKQLVASCAKYGVKVLTVFAFSTENWARPKEEVDFLMNLFEEGLKSDMEELSSRNDVKVSLMGNRCRLPQSLQDSVSSVEERAKDNKGPRLVMAVDYSGRYDITQAAKKIASRVRDGQFQVEDIDDALFEKNLSTNVIEFPNPDLMIRTSGESRVSNFMLWQLAYSELMFVDKLFPDVVEADFVEALTAFQQRQRRYGGHEY